MKYLLSILVLILLTACSTQPQNKTIVAGNKVLKSQFKEGELTEVKPLEGENIIDMMMRVEGLENFPKIGEFQNCKELLSLLKAKGIKPTVIEERLVKIKAPSGNNFTYEFIKDECLHET